MKFLITLFALTALVSGQTKYRIQSITGGVSSFDPVTKVSSTLFAVDGSGNLILKPQSDFSLSSHSHTFASLTSKPTTVSGYGITDAITATSLANGTLPISATTVTASTSVTSPTLRYVGTGATATLSSNAYGDGWTSNATISNSGFSFNLTNNNRHFTWRNGGIRFSDASASQVNLTDSGGLFTVGLKAQNIEAAGTVTASNNIILPTSITPASATTTGVAGTIVRDSNYIYVCVATNTWKRIAISTW